MADVRKGGGGGESVDPEAGVLDEHDSAKPAQRSSHRPAKLHRVDTVPCSIV